MSTRLFVNVVFFAATIWILAVLVAALLIVLKHYVPIVYTDPHLREGLKIVVATVVLLVVAWLVYLFAVAAEELPGHSDIHWYRTRYIGSGGSGVQVQGDVQGLEKVQVQKLF